jgi:HAD superfamily hydrolase (TIGR01457 family)
MPRRYWMSFFNKKEQLDRLKDIECFVLDMDGTFNLGMELIPWAMDFYNKVIGEGKRIMILTNNSSRDGMHYVDKLNKLGCPAKKEDIYTSGMATCQYVLREYAGKRVYLLGNEHLKKEFIAHGIEVVEENPNIVVIGYDTTLDYEKMCVVCDYVREGLPYIATHPDYNCPTETGFVPDIGAIISFIATSTGREPFIVGKPYAEIMLGLMQKVGLPKEKIAICGDRLYTDIAVGISFNILTCCVLTGETKIQDLEDAKAIPDLVFGGLCDMIPYL